jgi:hypothetical protein
MKQRGTLLLFLGLVFLVVGVVNPGNILLDVTVDNTAPNLLLLQPTDGSQVHVNEYGLVEWAFATSDYGSGLDRWIVTIDGVIDDQDQYTTRITSTSPNGFLPLTFGEHTLTVDVWDVAGNHATHAITFQVVQGSGYLGEFIAPHSGDVLSGSVTVETLIFPVLSSEHAFLTVKDASTHTVVSSIDLVFVRLRDDVQQGSAQYDAIWATTTVPDGVYVLEIHVDDFTLNALSVSLGNADDILPFEMPFTPLQLMVASCGALMAVIGWRRR